MAFEFLVLDPGLIVANSFNDKDFLLSRESTLHGIVGQEQDNHDPDEDGDDAEHQEQDLPGLEM